MRSYHGQLRGQESDALTTNFFRPRSRTPSHCRIRLERSKFVAMIRRLWKACKRRLRTGDGYTICRPGLAFCPLDLLRAHQAPRDRRKHDLARSGISGADRISTTFAGPSIFEERQPLLSLGFETASALLVGWCLILKSRASFINSTEDCFVQLSNSDAARVVNSKSIERRLPASSSIEHEGDPMRRKEAERKPCFSKG